MLKLAPNTRTKSASCNRAVIWRGPSPVDGAPLMAVLTGFARPSRNAKIGDMTQLWILREDVDPLAAAMGGQDVSTCGLCSHRWYLGGGCYVDLTRAPLGIWRACMTGHGAHDWTAGKQVPAWALARMSSRGVRLGAYGDPAMVPALELSRVIGWHARHTGYTHQSQALPRATDYRAWLMASADTVEQGARQRRAGWRTFRVSSGVDPASDEISCPASDEAGKRTTCASCGLCDGARDGVKSVTIRAHGARGARVGRRLELAGGAK